MRQVESHRAPIPTWTVRRTCTLRFVLHPPPPAPRSRRVHGALLRAAPRTPLQLPWRCLAMLYRGWGAARPRSAAVAMARRRRAAAVWCP